MRKILCLITGVITQASAVFGQLYFQQTERWTVHNQGQIQTVLQNIGTVGDFFDTTHKYQDPITGSYFYRTIYPRESDVEWALVIHPLVGGVVDRETLVTSWEFLPDEPPDNEFRYETIDITSPLYASTAHSEFDIICQYNDSISDPREVGSGHHPLGVRIIQRSMAWSSSNVDDFLIFDLEIINLGPNIIRRGYVGVAGMLMQRSRSYFTGGYPGGSVVGSLRSYDSVVTCDTPDSASVHYGLYYDGFPGESGWDKTSLLHALGLFILQAPGTETRESFVWTADYFSNFNILSYRPVRRTDNRVFSGLQGDRLRYYDLSNGYISFDQLSTAVDHSDEGWLPPPGAAKEVATNAWPSFTLGTGPFDLGPGQIAHFTYAIVGGENVHVNPTDFADYWDPYHPEVYYSKLDFTELMTNARWAKWVYDNPGVDTDGDGFFGKYRLCDGDTNWYEGDGVPDFRADVPPPSPKLKVIPSLNSLALRWNGYYSENAIDPFTKVKDFEGYRVYLGLDDRESSYSTLISWDYPNYNRYFLREKPNHTFVWETKDLPFTIDSLMSINGDDFYPLQYTKDNPLHVGDTQYAFVPVDYNLSSLISNGVHKVYPEAINPGTDSTLWTDDQLTAEHGRPLPKYYEYEYTIDNLLPTIPYYLSVSSFDFGYSKGNIPAKESSKRENQTIAYAQTPADSVQSQSLNVYVYPNPYIWQKDYHSLGYENRDNTQIPDRSHRINFGNLPPRCKISIFSLDGDLIRSWDHNFDPADPQAMHDAWDLITRNTMLPVAGLYYWVVESEGRTQIGKFVIVM